ncbi:MAG TPA: alanine racemase [Spirochaetota bacterium]|nr:alanine racemase [Spirochaetota bacterium]
MQTVKEKARVYLEIDLKAIRKNLRRIIKAVHPARVMPVLKADAYGLGVQPIAAMLAGEDIYGFGAAELKEALVLKKNAKPVNILGSLMQTEIKAAVKNNIICPVDSWQVMRNINREAGRLRKKAAVHVLVDSGMGRLGIPYQNAEALIRRTAAAKNLELQGVFSHFPDANRPRSRISRQQIKMFAQLQNKVADLGLSWFHLANSDGINNFPSSCFNLVRTGINLYGVFDLQGRHTYSLNRSLALKSRLIAVRSLPQGATIGYNCTCRLKKDTLVGTIPAGYADGIPLAASNKGYVLIKGKKCRLLGRVSMDYITVDISSVAQPVKGMEAVIIGSSGRETITVEDMARLKKTHPYDIICAIGNRVVRVYKNLTK